ncbi:MAG: SRPBCC family protein [Gemmatimonadales bacterium]
MPSRSTVLAGDIAAPVDRVFALLADPRRIPDWLPGCYGVGGAPLICKGARLLVRFGPRTTSFEITDFLPPNTLGWAEEGARTGSRTFFHLAFAGATTALRMKHVWTPQTLGAWFKSKLKDRRNTHRVLDMTLQNIRKLTTT